jgi:hypothetical protein
MQYARIMKWGLAMACCLACLGTINLTQAADRPALGAWSTMTRVGKQEFPGRMILLRNTGDDYDVVWDSTMPGGPKMVSVFSLYVDPKTQEIRMEQRETNTTAKRAQMEGGTLVFYPATTISVRSRSKISWSPGTPIRP